MQCGEGVSRRRQQLTLLTCGLAAVALVALGAAASSRQELRELLVIVVAFLTFYLRRFIPRRPGFTAYGFVLCLLATVFPGGSEQALSHAEVLAISFTVAFAVFFIVRPPNPLEAFAVGTRIFCSSVANLLEALAENPTGKRAGRCEHLVKRALRFNQALADNFLPGSESLWSDKLLLEQYEAWQLTQMLRDSLDHLSAARSTSQTKIWPTVRASLQGLARYYESLGIGGDSAKPIETVDVMHLLKSEVVTGESKPDLSWAYLGGILLAGRRMQSQAMRLASILREAEGRSTQ
jgi:hypothetical protein